FYTVSSPAGFRAFFVMVLGQTGVTDNSTLIHEAGIYFLSAAAPIFGAAVIAALAGNVLQGLPIFPSEAAAFKWERLNPVQGLSRLKMQVSWIQWLKLAVLVSVVGIVSWKVLSASWDRVVTLPAQSLDSSNSVLRSLTMRVVTYLTLAVGCL